MTKAVCVMMSRARWAVAFALFAVSSAGCGGRDEDGGAPTKAEAAPVTVTLNALAFQPGQSIEVRYNAALTPPQGQQYWLTITAAGAPEGDWGAWHYVASGATVDAVTAPAAPGAYEVRLHDLHPKYPARVIARQAVTVGGAAQAPVAAVQDPNVMAADGFPAIIPPPSSSPPTVAEWSSVQREVRVSGSSRLACKTKVLREWLSVTCSSNPEYGVPAAVSFSPSSAQIYKFETPGVRTSLTAQLIDGTPIHAVFSWRDPDGSFGQARLHVTWRGGRPTAWFDADEAHD